MKKTILFALLLGGILFAACDRDEIDTYKGDTSGIYFQYGGQTRFFLNIDAYYDKLEYSFSVEPDDVTKKVLETRLRTMGNVRNYDRKVAVVVDEENTTAVRGVHYDCNLDTIFVKAGEAEVMLPVTFYRTPDMRDQKFKLTLKVVDNEDFTVPFTRQKDTNVYYDSGDTINADIFTFIVSEIYTEPYYWLFFEDQLGTWSVNKFKLINKLCDLPAADWETAGSDESKVQAGRATFYAIIVRNYLQEMADAGTPVLDDDGVHYIQLGPGYEVDYSKYY